MKASLERIVAIPRSNSLEKDAVFNHAIACLEELIIWATPNAIKDT